MTPQLIANQGRKAWAFVLNSTLGISLRKWTILVSPIKENERDPGASFVRWSSEGTGSVGCFPEPGHWQNTHWQVWKEAPAHILGAAQSKLCSLLSLPWSLLSTCCPCSALSSASTDWDGQVHAPSPTAGGFYSCVLPRWERVLGGWNGARTGTGDG